MLHKQFKGNKIWHSLHLKKMLIIYHTELSECLPFAVLLHLELGLVATDVFNEVFARDNDEFGGDGSASNRTLRLLGSSMLLPSFSLF